MEPSKSSGGSPIQKTSRIEIGSAKQRGGRTGRIQIGGTKQRGETWQKAAPGKNVSENTADFFTARAFPSKTSESSKLGSAKKSGRAWKKTKGEKVREKGTALLATRSASTKTSDLPQYTPKIPPTLKGMPIELRVEFYKKLPIKDLLTLREVDSELYDEITKFLLTRAEKELGAEEKLEEEGESTTIKDKGKEKVKDIGLTKSEKETLKSYTRSELLNPSLEKIHLLEHLCAHLPEDMEKPTTLVEARRLIENGEPKDANMAKAFLDDLMNMEELLDHPMALKFILDCFPNMNLFIIGEAIKELKFLFYEDQKISPDIINMIVNYGSNVLKEIDNKTIKVKLAEVVDFKENFLKFLVFNRKNFDKEELKQIVNEHSFLHHIFEYYPATPEILETIKFLIEMGADVNLTGRTTLTNHLNGASPLYVAANSVSPFPYIKMLMENKADLKQALLEATIAQDEDAFQQLLHFARKYYDIDFLKDIKKDVKSLIHTNTTHPFPPKLLKILSTAEKRKKRELEEKQRVEKQLASEKKIKTGKKTYKSKKK